MKAWWTVTHDTVLDNDTLKGSGQEVFRLFALLQAKKWPCHALTPILVGYAEIELLCVESPPFFKSPTVATRGRIKAGSGLWSDVTCDSWRGNKGIVSWHRCRSDQFHHKSLLFKRLGVWWQSETSEQSGGRSPSWCLRWCFLSRSRADAENQDAFGKMLLFKNDVKCRLILGGAEKEKCTSFLWSFWKFKMSLNRKKC